MAKITKQKIINNFWHLPLSIYANIRYGFPSRNLTIIGVTGTDGKTTVTSLIHFLLSSSGKKCGSISTISAKYSSEEIDIGLHVTTPAHISFVDLVKPLFRFKIKEFCNNLINPEGMHKYLAYLKDKGAEFVVIESTSQGLDQHRLFGIKFDEVVYTNIREDHMDYHKTQENYLEAKSKLIKLTKKSGKVIINGDDESWVKLKEISDRKKKDYFIYSSELVKNINHSIDGISFNINNKEFKSTMIGRYNISNLLAAIYATSRYEDLDTIRNNLVKFTAPKGRMQIILKEPFSIIVDFAHTPSSLESALKSIQEIKKEGARIVTLFGCAGKRDKTRRKMGAISAKHSNITILAPEDPRDEKVFDINNEILEYGREEGGELRHRFKNHDEYKLFKIESEFNDGDFILFDENSPKARFDAIHFAMSIAKNNDIIFITGKGHEESLAFGNIEHPWSDELAINKILKIRK